MLGRLVRSVHARKAGEHCVASPRRAARFGVWQATWCFGPPHLTCLPLLLLSPCAHVLGVPLLCLAVASPPAGGASPACLRHCCTCPFRLSNVLPAVANLGEGNPASEELEFTLALVGLREMEADGVTDAARRAEKLAAMKVCRRARGGSAARRAAVA